MHAFVPLASELTAARSQMAFTLGVHIILASIGVACPAIMLIANWRGLRNRLPETRGIYIRVLASTVDTYFARAILDVMESVTNRQDWNAMMDKAGPLNTIRVVLDDLSARPQYARRIVALERQWGVHLRERPPVR